MTWEKIAFNEEQINYAGETLKKQNSTEEEFDKALEILTNWRAVHSYPMHIFQMRLKDKAIKLDGHSFIAQRLKRVPAIIYKLRRKYGEGRSLILLYNMQDIGGCRAVLSDAKLIFKLPTLLKGEIKHKLIKTNDYITHPKKEDGYRSLHLIYSFKSDRKGKKGYNGLLTEIQIRSRLQHLWATAVETTGFFTRQSLKTHEGDPRVREFFKLISSAFAKMEECPLVPNTPENEKELYLKIKEIEKELNIIKLMKGWKTAKEFFEQEIKSKKNAKLFLLELDILGEETKIKSYTEKEEKQALNDYSSLEKRHSNNKDFDVVLVGVETLKDLKKAYPNYFTDIEEFLKTLEKIINKY